MSKAFNFTVKILEGVEISFILLKKEDFLYIKGDIFIKDLALEISIEECITPHLRRAIRSLKLFLVILMIDHLYLVNVKILI